MSNSPSSTRKFIQDNEHKIFKNFPSIVGDGFKLQLSNTFTLLQDNIPGYEFKINVDGEDAGICSLLIESDIDKVAEFGNFGITVNPKFFGKKLPSRVATASYKVFRSHGQNSIVITHDENNQATEKACEELGAKYLDTLKFEDGKPSKKRYIVSF